MGGTIIDGINLSQMSREQMEPFAARIQQELEREREERNYFQLEREKIHTFWDISRQKLEECRAALRNKEKELEEKEEQHEEEMKRFHQKVKHLLYEQHIRQSELKAENLVSLKGAREGFSQRESQLLQEMRDLQSARMVEKHAHLEQLKGTRKEKEDKLKELDQVYEKNCQMLEMECRTSLETIIKELNGKNIVEIERIERRKAGHVDNLRTSYRKKFQDFKEFHEKVVKENSQLVENLQKELTKMKCEKIMTDTKMKNAHRDEGRILKCLKECQEQVEKTRGKLIRVEREKRTYEITKKTLQSLMKKFKQLQRLYDALQYEHEKVCQEKEKLERKLISTSIAIQKRFTLADANFQQRIAELEKVLTFKEKEIMEAFHIDKCDLLSSRNLKGKNVADEITRNFKEDLQRITTDYAKIEKSAIQF